MKGAIKGVLRKLRELENWVLELIGPGEVEGQGGQGTCPRERKLWCVVCVCVYLREYTPVRCVCVWLGWS